MCWALCRPTRKQREQAQRGALTTLAEILLLAVALGSTLGERGVRALFWIAA